MPVRNSNCYHGFLGECQAEERLRKSGKERGFLSRQSDVKPGFFILTFLEKCKVVHQVAPNKDGKYNKQSYDEAVEVIDEMISCKEQCEDPVSPPDGPCQEAPPHQENHNQKCKACSFISENKNKLYNHEKSHYLRKCVNCKIFVKDNSFSMHKRTCKSLTIEKMHCGLGNCTFSTYLEWSLKRHRKSHEGSFQCLSCPKFFKTPEKLQQHQKCHSLELESHPCQHCAKTFSSFMSRAKHVKRAHAVPVMRNRIGWRTCEENLQKRRKKGRHYEHCHEENCEFKTYTKGRLEKHKKHKHRKPPKQVFSCDGCGYKTNVRSRMMRHTKGCLRYIALKHRVVPIVTNSGLTKIAKKHNISLKMFRDLMKDFSKQNPSILMERGLEDALKESVEALSSWYSSDMINVIDSKGREKTTSSVIIKDVNHLISEIIARNNIKRPRVAIGLDGGQGKFLVTLHVYDLSDLTHDYAGYSQGGRRRSLIIGACEGCTENRQNLDTLLHDIQLEEWQCPGLFQFCGDFKLANIIFGISSHGSYCSCYICESHKVADNNPAKWVSNKRVREWKRGAILRTPRIVNGRYDAWRAKWRGKKEKGVKKKSKDDIKNFASVIGYCIKVAEALMDTPLLLLMPPDPLHIFLGLGNDLIKALFKEAEALKKAQKRKKDDPSVMDEFVQLPGIGLKPQRSMTGGQYTGPELKAVLTAAAEGRLPMEIKDREVIAQYCAAILDLHSLCVAKELDKENYKSRIQTFRDSFLAVYDLKVDGVKRDLVAATLKVHVAFEHVEQYMDMTGETMYTADTSPTESTHAALAATQRRHNLQSSHNQGTEKQLKKLTSSIKFQNYRNDFVTNNNEVEEPNLMLGPDDPSTVLASSLVGDSQVEDGHYKAKYEELRLQFENQQRILSDYEAKLMSRDQENQALREANRKLELTIRGLSNNNIQ